MFAEVHPTWAFDKPIIKHTHRAKSQNPHCKPKIEIEHENSKNHFLPHVRVRFDGWRSIGGAAAILLSANHHLAR